MSRAELNALRLRWLCAGVMIAMGIFIWVDAGRTSTVFCPRYEVRHVASINLPAGLLKAAQEAMPTQAKRKLP